MVKGQGCEDCAVKYVLGKPGCKTTGVIKYWNVRLRRDLGDSLAYLSNGRQCEIVGEKKETRALESEGPGLFESHS